MLYEKVELNVRTKGAEIWRRVVIKLWGNVYADEEVELNVRTKGRRVGGGW